MAAKKLKLAHPGKILREEFMESVVYRRMRLQRRLACHCLG